MLKSKRWNTLAVLLCIQVIAMALINVTTAFDITGITPIADRNIRTGNKMLYEREINENPSQIKQNAAAPASSSEIASAAAAAASDMHVEGQNEDVLDVNEIPVRYDEAQLWRIYNISDSMRRKMMPVADILENKYGKREVQTNSYNIWDIFVIQLERLNIEIYVPEHFQLRFAYKFSLLFAFFLCFSIYFSPC